MNHVPVDLRESRRREAHGHLRAASDVELTRRGRTRFSTAIVEVTSLDNTTVSVRYPRYADPV
ncbi:hypothetical protein ACPPVO_11935 [Dactylosporangium sp. McL0621]|uniref:hypothetical protein n=1 Tax=Dactylosporangium sp. McL0621 TaxID=3415678 RepID=UPI003CF90A1A